MNITISGLTACGKTYQSKLLSKNLRFKRICASDLLLLDLENLKNIRENREKHFWINDENIKVIENLRKNEKLDLSLDKYIVELCNKMDETIFESRTLPWLSKNPNLIKIYLNASLEERAIIAYNSREEKEYSSQEIREKIAEKDQKDVERFKKLYGFDISNPEGFDLVLENGKLTPEQTQEKLLLFMQGKILIKEKVFSISN